MEQENTQKQAAQENVTGPSAEGESSIFGSFAPLDANS